VPVPPGERNIRFQIRECTYSEPPNITFVSGPLYDATLPVTVRNNGVFEVVLSDLDTGIDFSKWLAVIIFYPVDNMLGYQALFPVPYAIHAKTADAPWRAGANAGQLYYDEGSVGIGTSTLDPMLQLSVLHPTAGGAVGGVAVRGEAGGAMGILGMYEAATGASAGVSGVGQLGGVFNGTIQGLYADSPDGQAISARSVNGFGLHVDAPKNYFSGNVGIGTDTPGAKLHVAEGGMKFSKTHSTNNAVVQQFILSPRPDEGIFMIDVGGSGASGHIIQLGDDSVAENRNRVITYGNVGIGTKYPGAQLDVQIPGDLRSVVNVLDYDVGAEAGWALGVASHDLVENNFGSLATALYIGPNTYHSGVVGYSEQGFSGYYAASVDPAVYTTNLGMFISNNSENTKPQLTLHEHDSSLDAARLNFGNIKSNINANGYYDWDFWKIEGKPADDYSNARMHFVYVTSANDLPIPVYALSIKGGGHVGILQPDPTYALDVNGMIGHKGLVNTSDLRLKKDVASLSGSLEKLSRLRGVSFKWNQEDKGDPGDHLGLIAQEVKEVYPELVHENNEGYLMLASEELIAPLIEAVKELKAQNQTLAAKNQELEARIEALEVK
jgi:hypothetical protein